MNPKCSSPLVRERFRFCVFRILSVIAKYGNINCQLPMSKLIKIYC
jgi:hypothetical protein